MSCGCAPWLGAIIASTPTRTVVASAPHGPVCRNCRFGRQAVALTTRWHQGRETAHVRLTTRSALSIRGVTGEKSLSAPVSARVVVLVQEAKAGRLSICGG